MRTLISALALCALAFGPGCQKADTAMAEKLDRIDKRTQKMEKQLAALSTGNRAAGAAAKRPPRPRPKPELTYSVPVKGTPAIGNPAAPVTIVEGYDFSCGWCEKTRPLVKEVMEEYGDKVRVVHKTFLFRRTNTTVGALASCAANKQGQFAKIEPLIWDKGFKQRKLDKETMLAIAEEIGLDMARFKADMAGPECAQLIQTDQSQLAAVGVTGTPAFFVNGRWLPERSKEAFKKLIDEELEKANKRIAAGTKAEDYYDEWVVGKGRKKL